MKKITLGILSLFCVSCYETTRNCKDYRTGEFVFEQEINGKLEKSSFIRTDSMEIETYNGKIDTSIVRWINDCEYVLQKKNPKNMAERKGVHIKILSTNESGYTFEYGIVGASKKEKGKITRK